MRQSEPTELTLTNVSVCCFRERGQKDRRARIPVLIDVNLRIPLGSIFALIGPSGCGKSTLLSVASGGLEEPMRLEHGQVRLCETSGGTDIYDRTPQARACIQRRFGFVHQDPRAALNDNRAVIDLVSDPLYIHCIPKECYGPIMRALPDAGRRLVDAVRKALGRLGLVFPSQRQALAYQMLAEAGLGKLGSYSIQQLSGGQRQRVAIARALVAKPDVLFLDEPTSALDVSIQAEIFALLMKLKLKFNCTYVIATHDLALVRQVADYVAVLDQGRIVEQGSTDSVLDFPQAAATKRLLAACAVSELR